MEQHPTVAKEGGASVAPTPPLLRSSAPSWAMTFSLLFALTAFFFTSEILLLWGIAIAILWTHFVSWRYPRDASAAWLVRLLCYGGIFAFYGGRPGVGAEWIFDAKTFNTLGLIAASEAILQAWRESPPNLRFQPLLVLQSGIIFLTGCNTYDDRYIRILAPLYLLSTLLALRDIRFRETKTTRISLPLQTRRVLALLLVVVCGGALHFSVMSNKDRIQYSVLRMMRRRMFQNAGISNQPTLSSTFNLMGSTRRVLRIEGALNDGHLRAASFDTYADGRWSPTIDERAKAAFPEPAATSENMKNVARITKLTELNKLIFAPLNSVEIIPGEGSSFDWNKTLGPIISEDPAPYTYQVRWSDEGNELGVPLHQGVLCAPPSAAELKRLLHVAPEIDPRVRELALRITRDAFDPADKVEAIATYLIANHKYSQRTRRGRTDPVSSFILERKAAHCEYFASAAAIMLRCIGVPTRYATGFLAHETEGNVTTVRERDAHAWTEAYIDGVGWVNVDATPADGTPEAQPKVSWFQRNWEKLQDVITRLREQATGLSRQQIFGLILIVAIVWLWERWRQARKRKLLIAAEIEYSTPEEMARLASRFEAVLQKHKITLPAGKPWSEYLTPDRDVPPEYSEFIASYNRARFGGDFDKAAYEKLQQILNRLEKKGNGHANANDTNGSGSGRAQRQTRNSACD